MTLNNENNNECCKCTTPEIYIELNQQGPQGRQGNPGVDGVSPEITVAQNTNTSYVLKIEDANGSFTTPNLKATLPLGGVDGQMLVKLSNEDGVVGWEGNIDNLVTLDGEQTIEGEKNFTADNTSIKQSLTFTDNNFNSINATQNGLGIYVDKNNGGEGATSNYFNILSVSQDRVSISPTDKTQDTQLVINSSANVPLVLSRPTEDLGYLHQGNVTAGENVTINKTDNGGIEISSTGGEAYTLPIASTTTLGGIKVGENLSITEDGVLNATAEAYNLPQANATTLGGIKANPTTDEDTQAVNIDPATGLLYTKAGGESTELVPATDTTLGGIIVGDGLKVDDEGLTSLDINTESPLQLQGSVPSNPYILTPEPGSNISFDDLDVIAFNPANGHNLLQDVDNVSNNPSVGTTYTLAVKNRTNGALDWKNNILEIPLYQQTDGLIQCSVGLNRDYKTLNNFNRTIGIIWANKDNKGNITPLYYVTTQVPTYKAGNYQKSCVYKFLDNGTEGNTSTTNYQVNCIYNYDSAYSAANGACLMVCNRCKYETGTNTYTFWTSGNTPCWNSSIFPEVKKGNPETWTKWQFTDEKPINWYQICTNAENISEDKFVNCAFYVTVNDNKTSWINDKYPLLAKFTGNLSRIYGENFVEYINQMNQHYVEASPASGTPTLSLNYDNSTIKVNEEGQLYANVSLPDNITTQGNTFNGASQLVQLDSTGKLPALDGSQLTNLPSGNQEIESIPAGSDFNNFLSTGIYIWPATGGISNNPNTNMRGYLQVFRFQDNISLPVVQLYYTCDSTTTNPPEVWIRYCVNGSSAGYTWTTWNKVNDNYIPSNMVTTDTNQTITGTKTFTAKDINFNYDITFRENNNSKDVLKLSTSEVTIPVNVSFNIEGGPLYLNGSNANAQAILDKGNDTYGLRFSVNGDVYFLGPVNPDFSSAQQIVTTADTNGIKFWRGTQTEYDGITSKDENTLYIITGQGE